MPADLPPFLIKFARLINTMNERIGRAVSWLVLAMVLITVYDVSMRYIFRISSGMLEELEWHFFGIIFLLGAAYTLKHNSHVSVDILYNSRWVSDKMRLWVNLLGTVLFLIPFSLLIVYTSYPMIETAYITQERSTDPGGLPYRFIIESAIPLGFSLLILQGISYVIECVVELKKLAHAQGNK